MKLDIKKIFKEAVFFKGKHDLQSFRSIDCQSATTIKTIKSIEVDYQSDNLVFNICAKSFLHSQVRIMVGTLVDIGKGLIKNSVRLRSIRLSHASRMAVSASSFAELLALLEC